MLFNWHFFCQFEVLHDSYCKDDMRQSLTERHGRDSNFEIDPRVLCVGLNHTYKTRFFLKDLGKGEGVKEIVTADPAEEAELHRALGRARTWYVSAPGVCSGDSGGPLVRKLPGGRYALIGVVSKGTKVKEENSYFDSYKLTICPTVLLYHTVQQ